MKRIYLVLSLCMVTSFSFAQKKAIKDAKDAMKKDVAEARALIAGAINDPETKGNPETWKVAGDIEYKVFSDEFAKEQQRGMGGTGGNEEAMYTGLYNLYAPYVTADSLGEFPDEKGKIKNKYRRDISDIFKTYYIYYMNAGVFYNQKEDHSKASRFFEKYWQVPKLEMFKNDKDMQNLMATDTTYQTIKYYAAIMAYQAKEHERAITLFKNMLAEGPYLNNSIFSESDPYELLVGEYSTVNDSIGLLATLKEGAIKFPGHQLFTPNLINELIRRGQSTEAQTFLDQAIANNTGSNCDLKSVKATLLADNKDFAQAEAIYEETLKENPNCGRALEGMGVLYILKAQELKNISSQSNNKQEQAKLDKETVDLYLKSLPLLEKFRDLLKVNKAPESEVRTCLLKLQNAYYNLSTMGVDKAAELKAIDAELGEVL